jgi:hypothetical protein
MAAIRFTKWEGNNGIREFIINQTGCLPFSGAGINPRPQQRTTILKSVDNTYYYDDNLDDINNVEYTLFGHNGDQSINEVRFNAPLLNENITHHIYLYRVRIFGGIKEYLWYGEYQITGMETRPHIGKDRQNRNIIVLSLSRI